MAFRVTNFELKCMNQRLLLTLEIQVGLTVGPNKKANA